MVHERINAILVDDENDGREVLSGLLERYCPEVRLLGTACDAEQAYEMIMELRPQLVFLDIQMPRGDGFSLLKRFPSVPFETIFVTGYDHYAINAVRFSALDYLLKPVDITELRDAVKRAMKVLSDGANRSEQVGNLLWNLNADTPERKISIHVGDKVKLLPVKNIESVEAESRYSRIRMKDGSAYVTVRHLKEFEDYFGNAGAFLRISKSCIINIGHVSDYGKGEPCLITMESGSSFEISRRKKREVLERLRSIYGLPGKG